MRKTNSLIFRVLALIMVLCLTFTSCDLLGGVTGGGTVNGGNDSSVGDNSGNDTGNSGDGDNQSGNTDSNQGGTTDNNQSGTDDSNQGGTTDNNQGDNSDNNQGDNSDNNQGGNGQDGTTVTGTESINGGVDIPVGDVIVPKYLGEGDPWYVVNGNMPYFTDAEKATVTSYEKYGALDSLGRCTAAICCLGKDLMPTDERGSISSVTPTGWVQEQYDIVPGKYLYNRSHLVGWQLTDEDANKQNLITGTPMLNQKGMKRFEDMVADYIKETNNHVMYRVTPIFEGNNLLASGVLMEAYSVEDAGDGICFNVFIYNVQTGIGLDYATGRSWEIGAQEEDPSDAVEKTYVLNTKSKKIHEHDCSAAAKISAANREEVTGVYSEIYAELSAEGYTPCGICDPE